MVSLGHSIHPRRPPPPVRVITSPGFTPTIRRKSLFDTQTSIDPWGIFTLYTSDICKPPSSSDRQTFAVRAIIIPNDTALPRSSHYP
jgi:hypothetical protein